MYCAILLMFSCSFLIFGNNLLLIHHTCYVLSVKPFIFLLDMTKLVPGPLKLRLKALNANHHLQQVLLKICILVLQCTEHRENTVDT